jgi:RNA-directed DNA polymerase
MRRNCNKNKKRLPRPSRRNVGWFNINWRLANARVKQHQMIIAVAYKAGDMEKVKRLQYQLVNSWARKSIAVKTVTSNKGKKTAGVDGVIWETSELKRQRKTIFSI